MTKEDEVALAKTALVEAKDKDGHVVHGVIKIQKALRCGYSYAVRIMLHLESIKFISEPDHLGLRRVM
jgi:DNA segregation ATPase FtsK/SpoIIIE-like protein